MLLLFQDYYVASASRTRGLVSNFKTCVDSFPSVRQMNKQQKQKTTEALFQAILCLELGADVAKIAMKLAMNSHKYLQMKSKAFVTIMLCLQTDE